MAFYRDFSIPKKNGKPRLISAPDRDLKKKAKNAIANAVQNS